MTATYNNDILDAFAIVVSHRERNAPASATAKRMRDITAYGEGFWRMIGAGRKALAALAANDFDPRGLSLVRDHMHQRSEFISEVVARRAEITLGEFSALWDKYGQVVLVLKDENPNNSSGFGVCYSEADIVMFAAPIDTHHVGRVPSSADAKAAYRAAHEVWRLQPTSKLAEAAALDGQG